MISLILVLFVSMLVVGVLVCTIVFARQGDWVYVLTGLIVAAALIFSLFSAHR